ncbi:MAG: hypothetical protein E6J68_02005, partial [Deltaproteobacteria bacterium]
MTARPRRSRRSSSTSCTPGAMAAHDARRPAPAAPPLAPQRRAPRSAARRDGDGAGGPLLARMLPPLHAGARLLPRPRHLRPVPHPAPARSALPDLLRRPAGEQHRDRPHHLLPRRRGDAAPRGAAAVLLAFLVIPAAVGVLITTGLVLVFPARGTRDALMVGVGLAVAALVVAIRFLRPERLADPSALVGFASFLGAFGATGSPYLPTTWAAETLLPLLGARPGEPLFYFG